MSEPKDKTCPFCEKKGLAILPLRAALGRTDTHSEVLELPGGFKKDEVASIDLPANSAQYTTRLLRPGYLYVFNEVRGEWKGYVVTPQGFLYEFDPEEEATPADADKIEFSCYRTGEEYIARCITIPNAKHAGKVWLGFSDTAWTQNVLDKHRAEAYRKRHMRVVNVQDWAKGSTDQDGTEKFSKLTSVVNEFTHKGVKHVNQSSQSKKKNSNTLNPVLIYGYPAFGFSPHEFQGIEHEAEGLLDWGKKADYEPMMVSVPDPVGITAELASLLGARHREFPEEEDIQRPLAISSLLGSLRESIRNNAELSLIRRNQEAAEQIIDKSIASRGLYWLFAEDGAAERERAEFLEQEKRRHYNLTEQDLENAADNAWSKYKDQLAEIEVEGEEGKIELELEHWRKHVLEPKRDAYDKQYVIPLAKAHQAWFDSRACTEYFQCNYDITDADSGVGYIQALLLCIQDTQQNKICADNYVEWIKGDITDPTNVILRGLIHNQKDIADAISSAESNGVNLADVPWSVVIKVYKESLAHIDKGGKNLVAQLITAVGGPIVKILDTGIDQTAGRLLVKLGVIAESSVEKRSHVGTLDDAMDAFVAWMKRAHPEALADADAALLKQRLEIQSRGNRVNTRTRDAAGQFAAGKTELRFDRFALSQIEEGLSEAEVTRRAAGVTLSMDAMPKQGLARFKAMFDTQSRLAVIGLLLDAVGLMRLSKNLDEKTTMANRLTENKWKFRSAAMSFVGGVGELIHDGIKASAQVSGRLSSAASSVWVKALGVGGKALGIAGALIVAAWDGYHFINELKTKHYGMAALYLGSVASNVGAMLLFTEGGAAMLGITSAALATGIGVILVVIGIGIALAISYFHTNELQEWMARCLFGSNEAERYDGLEEAMEQFKIAIESMKGGASGDDEAPSNMAGLASTEAVTGGAR